MTPDEADAASLYEALERDLRVTESLEDALFIDKGGRLRTHPTRKPPPGGTPAHLNALLEIPEYLVLDNPVPAAVEAGAVRIRLIRSANRVTLSIDAAATTPEQDATLIRIADELRPEELDARVVPDLLERLRLTAGLDT